MTSKRAKEPRLWVGDVQAWNIEKREWESTVVIPLRAHVTRKAGLAEITDSMYRSFDPKLYSKHEIISAFGMRWSEIENAFSDFRGGDDDDDDHSDDLPISPGPEDHDADVFARELMEIPVEGDIRWRVEHDAR
jgi:hypothetical protein